MAQVVECLPGKKPKQNPQFLVFKDFLGYIMYKVMGFIVNFHA
jgi:hypothetical protein